MVLVELLLLALLVMVALLVLAVLGAEEADEGPGIGICLPLIQVCAVDTACLALALA